TLQACPMLGPLSHVPFLQRGQTRPTEVRKTSEKSFTWRSIVPVWMLPVAVGGVWKRLRTQTGTCAARSGSGGPKGTPLSVPAPIGAVAVQFGFVLASHPLMQRKSCEPGVTRKLWDVPVQPLSRSVHLSATVRIASSGPPCGFLGQGGRGSVVVVVVANAVVVVVARVAVVVVGGAVVPVTVVVVAETVVTSCVIPGRLTAP